MPVTQVSTPSSNPLYNRAVDLNIWYGQGGSVFQTIAGTGFSIGNGIIITAAHNFVIGNEVGNFPTSSYGQLLPSVSAGPQTINASGVTAGTAHPGQSTIGAPGSFQNLGGYAGAGNGNDLGVIIASNISTALTAMIIYSDPSEAQGNIFMSGFPGRLLDAQGNDLLPGANSNTLFESSGHLSAGNVTGTSTAGGYVTFQGTNNAQAWRGDPGFGGAGGMSGSGVFLTPDNISGLASTQYLAGVFSNGSEPNLTGTTTGGVFEPMSDIYSGLANLLSNVFGTNFGAMFATNALIADQDGVINGVANDFVNGTGFNEDIYITNAVGTTVFGGGGFDTVIYSSPNANISLNVEINDVNHTAQRNYVNAQGQTVTTTDTLINVDVVTGTVFSDTFQINALPIPSSTPIPRLINGGSIFQQMELPGTKNTSAAESLQGGGRLLSAAQIAAILEKETGVLFNHEDQDTITVAQALLDAGAAVTYYSDQGTGLIYLNGVEIGYQGFFHEPVQQPEDFFGGIPVGGHVGFNGIGETVLDLSGVVGAITETLLGGITLWGLVDSIEVGAGDVTLDLGAIGVNVFTGGDGIDDIIGGVLDVSRPVGRSPNNLSGGQIIGGDVPAASCEPIAANDNVPLGYNSYCAVLAPQGYLLRSAI